MIADFHIGGVLLPGLIIVAVVALACTIAIVRFFSVTDIYCLFSSRPLVEVSIFAIIFSLLIFILLNTKFL